MTKLINNLYFDYNFELLNEKKSSRSQIKFYVMMTV